MENNYFNEEIIFQKYLNEKKQYFFKIKLTLYLITGLV